MMDKEDSFHSACSEEPKPPQLKGLIKEVSQLETNSIMHESRMLELKMENETLDQIFKMYCEQLKKTEDALGSVKRRRNEFKEQLEETQHKRQKLEEDYKNICDLLDGKK